jgi:peptidoglycan/LPS O-acetylase OafA/YrhL
MNRISNRSDDSSPLPRIAGLDGVRGLAALGVLVWHFGPTIAAVEPGSTLAYACRAVSLAWAGVDLFFALSGFLIASILLRAAGSPRYFLTFYVRRAARILPLYFVLLAVLAAGNLDGGLFFPAVLRPLFESQLPGWSFPVFAQNLFMPGINDFGPKLTSVTWSLAVEEQFYLILPFLLWATPHRHHAAWVLACFLAAPLLRALLPAGMATYVLLPCRLDGLMAGVLLALAWQDTRWREALTVHRGKLLLLWIGLALPAVMLVRGGAGLWALRLPGGWLVNTWLAVWSTLTIGLVLGGQAWLAAFFQLRPLLWLGKIAYGLYLLHPAVLWLTHAALLGREPVLRDGPTAAVTALAALLSLAAAAASHRWIEEPFVRRARALHY